MMDIVTGCSRESPLDFRANPQIRGTARRPHTRMRRRRIHAEYAVITALISAASSVAVAAQLPVTFNAVPTPSALTALIRPAPTGEITPEPQIPTPTANPIAPPVAAPPPRAEQPKSPPRQPAAPAPQSEAPAPQPEAPAPQQEAPPAQPPPRGHVQLAP